MKSRKTRSKLSQQVPTTKRGTQYRTYSSYMPESRNVGGKEAHERVSKSTHNTRYKQNISKQSPSIYRQTGK